MFIGEQKLRFKLLFVLVSKRHGLQGIFLVPVVNVQIQIPFVSFPIRRAYIIQVEAIAFLKLFSPNMDNFHVFFLVKNRGTKRGTKLSLPPIFVRPVVKFPPQIRLASRPFCRFFLNLPAPPDVVFLGNRARTAHEKGNYYVSTWRNDDGLMVENVDSVQIEAKNPS